MKSAGARQAGPDHKQTLAGCSPGRSTASNGWKSWALRPPKTARSYHSAPRAKLAEACGVCLRLEPDEEAIASVENRPFDHGRLGQHEIDGLG